MPGYAVRTVQQRIGAHLYRLRVLRDAQQYADPDLHGARAGVSPEHWSLFGQLWPAGIALADAMDAFPAHGLRVLELGCGIALPSLVLQRRGVQVTASDRHPLAEVFLAYNAALNALPALPFRTADWDVLHDRGAAFDAVIASDVLYDRGHAEAVSGAILRLAAARAQVVVIDPRRGHAGRFARLLGEAGFVARPPAAPAGLPALRVLHFQRPAESAA